MRREKRPVDPARVKSGFVIHEGWNDEMTPIPVQYVETAMTLRIVSGEQAFGYSRRLPKDSRIPETLDEAWRAELARADAAVYRAITGLAKARTKAAFCRAMVNN
jgi:hypothetical protein